MAHIDRGPETPDDNEIMVERVLEFPVEKVWAAWASPQAVEKWWGPRGFQSKIQQMELKTSGAWKQSMLGPDGIDHPSSSLFLEVIPKARISFRYVNPVGTTFTVQWNFTPEDGKTFLRVKMIFESREARRFMVEEFAADRLAQETVDKLQEYLASS